MAENRWSFVSETIEDNTKLPVSTEFIKTWVIKNAGDTTWTRDYKLKFASNEMMSSQTSFPLSADVPPGGQAVLTVPMVAPHKVGNYMSHWQLVDASGTALKSATTSGTTFLWLKIKVVPADEIVEPLKEDISFWIWESETIADNTSLASGTKFTKTWTFRNAGPAIWTSDYSIGFVGKDSKNQLASESSYPFPKDVAPDDTITLTVPMIVPGTKGTYRSDWALFDAQGNLIPMKSKKKITSFWAKIKAIPQSEIKGSKWILLDETIPDGEGITIESKFDKTWIFRNVGPATWTTKYRLQRVDDGAYKLAQETSYPLGHDVIPGDEISLTVPMTAPPKPGIYREKWRILDEDGKAVTSKQWGGVKTFWVEIAALSDHVADGFCWPGGDIDNKAEKWGGWRDAQPFKSDRRGAAAKAKRSPFFHPGGDLNGPGWGDKDLGLAVHAIGHGVVVFMQDVRVWGNVILIEHVMADGKQFWSQYAHMQDVYVEEGQKVNRGDEIGTVGKGGNERYLAHLHFEMRHRFISAQAWNSVVYNETNLNKYYVDPLTTIQKYFFNKDEE